MSGHYMRPQATDFMSLQSRSGVSPAPFHNFNPTSGFPMHHGSVSFSQNGTNGTFPCISFLLDVPEGWLASPERNLTIYVENDMCSVSSQGITLLLRVLIIGRLYMAVAVVALLYDHVITLDQEVQRIWKRPFSGITVLFLLNRYLPPMLYVAIAISLGKSDISPAICGQVLPRLVPVLVLFGEVVIGALLLYKMRAMWADNINPAAAFFMLLSFVVQLGLGIIVSVNFIGGGPIPGAMGCFFFFALDNKNSMRLLLQWFSNIIFHTLVFLCTFKRTIRVRYEGFPAPLSTLLLHDGTVYFCVLMAAKLVNLTMLVVFPEFNSINWVFNHVFDVILTSRVLLNLRQTLHTPVIDSARGYTPLVLNITRERADLEAKESFPKTRFMEQGLGMLEMLTRILREDGYNWTLLGSDNSSTVPNVKHEARDRVHRRYSF